MLTENLKTEIIIQCQNVQCSAKLMAEIDYNFKDDNNLEDIFFIQEILKFWPELKCVISYHPDKDSQLKGWKILTIYKYAAIENILNEINKLEVNSALYHFVYGKLFGYNDFEVMNFIKKHNNDTLDIKKKS